MLKKVLRAVVVLAFVLLLILLLVWWLFGRSNLLMAATYGVGDEGSYERWEDSDVIEWRSRTHFLGSDMMDPPDGYGLCEDPGDNTADSTEGHLDDTYAFFRIDRVYLFNGERPFHLDGNRIVYTPRPVDFLAPPESDGDGPFTLESLEAELRSGGALNDERLSDQAQQDQAGQEEPDEPDRSFLDPDSRSDRDIFTDTALRVAILRQYRDRLLGQLNEIYGPEAATTIFRRYEAGEGLRSLVPTPVDATDHRDFSAALTTLAQQVAEANADAEGEDKIDELTIGLDFVLQPMMSHAIGADDPTPVSVDAVSEALVAAAATEPGLTTGGDPRRIWVADYGLPVGADQALWPTNISHVAALGGQPAPVTGDEITAEYGHGLMVASVAAQVAPEADVTVINVAETDPTGRQWVTTKSIDEGLLTAGVIAAGDSTLNFSLGAYDCTDLGVGNPGGLTVGVDWSEGLWAVLEPYVVAGGIQVVAGAGNDATDTPLYPAAFDEVVGVAATDDTVLNADDCLAPDDIESYSHLSATTDSGCQPDPDALARFSNHGDNEDDRRPGVDLVVHYPLLASPIVYDYLGHAPVSLDTGKVRISGTSLSSPRYAACLQPDGTTKC